MLSSDSEKYISGGLPEEGTQRTLQLKTHNLSTYNIGIKAISSKGTGAVAKNLQQDLVDFLLWQLRGFSLAIKGFL